jgi:hypothetical protein
MLMNKTNQQGFHIVMIPLIVIILGIIGFTGWYVWDKNQNQTTISNPESSNNNNASNLDILKSERNQIVTVITADNTPTPTPTPTPTNSNSEVKVTPTPTPQATIDEYGPSTKLDRPNVHAVVLNLYPIYANYLYLLRAADQVDRQSVSNQYLADNKQYFSEDFYNDNINNTSNLSLLLQSPSVTLPVSLTIGSAIMDPEVSNIVTAQIIMKPDITWSILVDVKTKDWLGNFGTIEKVYIRQNTNPL